MFVKFTSPQIPLVTTRAAKLTQLRPVSDMEIDARVSPIREQAAFPAKCTESSKKEKRMKQVLLAAAAAFAIGLPSYALAAGNGSSQSTGANSNGGNYATQNIPSQRIVNNSANGEGAALVISGAGVREVQQALNRLGYEAGQVNGNWDRNTVLAMKNFQGAHGLEPTGNLDISSIAALGLWTNLIGNPLGNGNSSLVGNATGAPPPRGTESGNHNNSGNNNSGNNNKG